VHIAVNSSPYWPAKRFYIPGDTQQLGMEPTVEEYISRLVAIYAEVWRVLRPDGVLWVLIDDWISNKPYLYSDQSYNSGKSSHKLDQTRTVRTQDTTYLAPAGDWLLVPERFAMAMQTAGWRLRDKIIWNKSANGRKDSTQNRSRHNYEYLFMFTKKQSGYWYDADTLRVPLASEPKRKGSQRTRGWEGQSKSRKDGVIKGYATPERHKDGTLRRDGDRDYRVISNSLGRICDAVWTIAPENWRGIHSSAMPVEMARRCLLLTCPPGGTALDPMGGSGTVSVAAKQLGSKSIYIDRCKEFLAEARHRVATGADRLPDAAANDNKSAASTAD
jgi:DNA modification methylase